MSTKRKRIPLLDTFRGAAMFYVVLYHIMFDICFIWGRSAPSFLTPGNAVFEGFHVFFLWVLFFVSGVCSALSRSSLKRGAVLYILGYLITAGTAVIMPSELIVFGVLSCFGACMVITSLLSPLTERMGDRKVFLAPLLFLLWFVFRRLSYGQIDLLFTRIDLGQTDIFWLYPLGLPGKDFRSADYFPLIPYIFMFLCGRVLSEKVCTLLEGKEQPIKVIDLAGKYSLWVYIIHQPVVMLILGLIFGFGI